MDYCGLEGVRNIRGGGAKRLGVGRLVYAGVAQCTATSTTLTGLSEALEFGGPKFFNEALREYGTCLTEKVGESTEFQRGVEITLAPKDCRTLSRALRKLAGKKDRSEVSLAELGLLEPSPPLLGCDLVFYKLDAIADLKSDYRVRNIGGGHWEGVLYHRPPTLNQFKRLREVLLDWRVPTSEGYERCVYAQSHAETVEVDLPVAYRRLMDPEDGVFQVNIYLEHPLVLPYQSPYRCAKIWLYEDMSEILISQHCSWSGDLLVDIRNFLSYGKVLRRLIDVLDVHAVAWGDTADSWPMEETIKPDSLENLEVMWGLFVEMLEPMLVDVSVLSDWREDFEREFRGQENGEGELP